MSEPTAPQTFPSILPLRLKVKRESYAWLNAAAIEVNQCWNYAKETSLKAVRPYDGPPRYLSAFDLDKLTAGACHEFQRIGSGTIQRINAEYVTRRQQAKKVKLRWRKSRGSRRSLGWIPFKAEQIKRGAKAIRFAGKTFRVFEFDRLAGHPLKSGCFAEDPLGDWWLCIAVQIAQQTTVAPHEAVGIDLGLKDIATTREGEKLEAHQFYRNLEPAIAQAQRRGHKRQAKRLHRKAARCRQDALHKFSRSLIDRYQMIVIGDVSSTADPDAHGEVRARCGVGDPQNAAAVQGPAGRPLREDRQ